MAERQYHRNIKRLWGLILLAMVCSMWFYRVGSLTGNSMLDGSLGVLLGLYICSHPAANAIDLLFFERAAFGRVGSGGSSVRWLALNILTLLMGWIVIVIGTTRFTSRPT